MRCRVEVPTSWPDDDAWQQGWRTMIAPLLESRVGPDGRLELPWPEPVRLVGGPHLALGATYEIAADRLHQGRLEATIERRDRTIRATWSPRAAGGRAEVLLRGLDRCSEIRATSSLKHLNVELELAPRPTDLVRLRVRLDWLAVDFTVRGTTEPGSHRLICDLEAHGTGLWRPTLAPLLAAMHGSIQQSVDDTAQDLARSLAEVAGDESYVASDPVAEAVATIRVGMDQIGARLHAVAETVAALPWWRQTTRRWRRELAALPDVRRPSTAVLVTARRWTEMERTALDTVLRQPRWRRGESVDGVVADLAEAETEYRRLTGEQQAVTSREAAAAPPELWLTDANLDTRWLATPWSTIRRLLSLSSDAEAEREVAQFVADGARD